MAEITPLNPQSCFGHYFARALLPAVRTELVKMSLKRLRAPDVPDFDKIVVRGVSGITFGAVLAHLLDKALFIIRKSEEWSHSGSIVTGPRGGRYLIVDDFISGGNTMRAIAEDMAAHDPGATVVGVFLYRGGYMGGQMPQELSEIPIFTINSKDIFNWER